MLAHPGFVWSCSPFCDVIVCPSVLSGTSTKSPTPLQRGPGLHRERCQKIATTCALKAKGDSLCRHGLISCNPAAALTATGSAHKKLLLEVGLLMLVKIVVCKARLAGRDPPHRPHHQLCPNNKRTKGVVSEVTLKQRKINKSLSKLCNTPLQPQEKASAQFTTKASATAFF